MVFFVPHLLKKRLMFYHIDSEKQTKKILITWSVKVFTINIYTIVILMYAR